MALAFLFDTDRVIDFLSAKPEARDLVARHLSDGIAISIVAYTELLEGILGARGTMLDLFIAATALHHDLTLVTRNTRDYADVAALKLYAA